MKPSNIQRLLKNLKNKHKQQQKTDDESEWIGFFKDLDDNEKMLRDYLGYSQDVMFSRFQIHMHNKEPLNATLVAIDGIVDGQAIRDNIMQPLIAFPLETETDDNLTAIRMRLSVKKDEVEANVLKAIDRILKAQALLMIDGVSKGILVSIEAIETRSIEEPDIDRVVRGSKEGFIEDLSVNLSMIRRRIAHPALRFETLEIGEYSQTDITVAYVKDIADPELIDRVKKRLHQIQIDNVNNSGDIEQLIEDHPYSIFPTTANTGRPDRASALLMEGRVLVLVDGDPVTLLMPSLFVENIKNIGDYSARPYYVSFIRFIRFVAFIFSITLPALYMAAVNFNQSLIPTDLIVPISMAAESVPFPLTLEMLILIIMFEVVREAGVRLPEQIGTAVSIIGPLLLGEVAVTASLIGAPTVIIISMSYIASFVITPIADVTALLRLVLFIAAVMFGSFGLVVVLLAVFTHMVSLTSLGVPYMAPFSPLHFQDWKDAFIRFPTKLLKKRDKSIPNQRPKKVRSVPDTRDKQ